MKKLNNLLVLTLFLLSNFSSLLPQFVYAEEGRDVSSNVTSLSVDPKNVRDGENFTVRLEFDEKSIDIKPQDYIRVSWNSNGEIFGTGYNKNIDLLIQGKNVGTIYVKNDNATIVFNENIRNLNDVEGWAQFEMLARNLTNTSQENTGDLTISSGNKNAEVSVTKPASGNSSVFYYKTGDMLPEDTQHVRWFLNINNNKAYVEKEVYIIDEIQRGQRLDPDTFEITTEMNGYSKNYRGTEGVAKFLTEYPGSTFNYSVDDNTITVILPANIVNLTTFRIAYKTIITNDNQESFVNNSTAWFKEYNQPAVEGEAFNHSVKNINISGGITGTVKGELKLVKNIQGTDIGIPNVQFELRRVDGQLIQGKDSVTLKTNEQGVAVIKGLAVGEYAVKEISAPEWIHFDPLNTPEIKFSISETDTKGIELNITNEKKKINVTATKKWEGGELPRPTIYFKLFRAISTDNKLEEISNINLGEIKDGQDSFTWNDLDQYDDYGNEYKYSVKEVDQNGNDFVPNGYKKIENGLTVTNQNIEQVNITGTKTWNDNENQDGKRPKNITVNLLANGKQVQSKEVSETDGWKYEFTNLPKYENGQEITYTVTENQVPEYNTEIKGFDITNSYTPGKTSVSVTKTWNDNNNQDGLRPNSIKVQLYANGEAKGSPIELTEGNQWNHTWNDLAEKAKGQTIAYTVKEVDQVPGYTSQVDESDLGNVKITNTHNPETTEVSGQKTWNDNEDQDGKRPKNITVNLLANGKQVQSKEVSETDGWKYEFTNLPKYENGQEITYTVTENQVLEYNTEIKGFDITNSYTPGKTSVSVTKTWNDNNNQDGLRPNSIKVQLYANGEAKGSPIELTEGNQWNHTWNDLAEKAKGQTIAYTVKEVDQVPGYTSQVDESDLGNVKITNTHNPETTEVSGQKTWNDNEDQDGKRPKNITVNLLANGKQVQSKEVSETDGWKYEFTNLPKYENGQEITYTVTENQVPEYNTEIKGFDITNSYTPGKTSVSVTKTWNDNNNQDGLRPNSIKVQLYANGEAKGSPIELTEGNQWNHTWNDLAEKAKGQTIAYTVKEVDQVPGYTSQVDESDLGNVKITNTHNPETTEVSGQKTWNDNEDQDGKRPKNITVNLLANGKQVQSKEVSETDGWKYEFTNLPKYENGQEITYTVTENQVPEYNTEIKGFDITNSYTPGKTSVSVTKTWNDNNNQDGLRPNSIKVQLYANGKEFGNVVKLSENNSWTTTWNNLSEKSGGQTVTYTVKEVGKVDGYTSQVNEKNMGNIVITNTHKVDKKSTLINKENNKVNKDNIIKKFLPRTGSHKSNIFILLGILVLAVSLILWIKKYKK
ncbi:Cna B-type domain-containing protein [Enterococcus sp. DIV0691]|uniref:Cna B-type domain-containing protein n=1 Tax=Enterococcus sp. DIV0691 TaxID=2774703 RepID=UPI003F200E79